MKIPTSNELPENYTGSLVSSRKKQGLVQASMLEARDDDMIMMTMLMLVMVMVIRMVMVTVTWWW